MKHRPEYVIYLEQQIEKTHHQLRYYEDVLAVIEGRRIPQSSGEYGLAEQIKQGIQII